MQQCFEAVSIAGFVENPPPQCTPIEGTVRVQDIFTKGCHHVGEAGLTRQNDFSRDHVSIDDRGTVPGEHVGDSALAAGDAACQTDAKWLTHL